MPLMRAYLWFSLCSCARGVGGSVGKNSVVFKNWKSLEKNTEGKREREGGERGGVRWRDREGKKGGGGGGRLLQQTGVRSSYKLKVSSV